MGIQKCVSDYHFLFLKTMKISYIVLYIEFGSGSLNSFQDAVLREDNLDNFVSSVFN